MLTARSSSCGGRKPPNPNPDPDPSPSLNPNPNPDPDQVGEGHGGLASHAARLAVAQPLSRLAQPLLPLPSQLQPLPPTQNPEPLAPPFPAQAATPPPLLTRAHGSWHGWVKAWREQRAQQFEPWQHGQVLARCRLPA